jgi:hypothetical protein
MPQIAHNRTKHHENQRFVAVNQTSTQDHIGTLTDMFNPKGNPQ